MALSERAALGSSGAWVTLGDKLCGHIIAVRQDIPWAYMSSIQAIFDDIKSSLDIDDVRLPTIAEVQLAASYPGMIKRLAKHHLEDSYRPPPTSKSAATNSKGWPAVSLKPSQSCHEMALETKIDYFPMERLSHSQTELPDSIPSGQEQPSSTLWNRDTRSRDLREDDIINKKSASSSTATKGRRGTTSRSITSESATLAAEGIPDEISRTPTNRTLLPAPMIPDLFKKPRTHSHSTERANPYRQEVVLRQNTTTPPLSLSGPRESNSRHLDEEHIGSRYQTVKEEKSRDIPRKRLINMPMMVWRRFETFILRTEYQRRKQKRRFSFFPTVGFITFSARPNHPSDRSSGFGGRIIEYIKTSGYIEYIKTSRYHLLLLLGAVVAFGNILLNIMYSILFFPFVCWVLHRHHSVLEDEEVWRRQLQESFQMLGNLPQQYNDNQLMKRADPDLANLDSRPEPRSSLTASDLEVGDTQYEFH
ncbi:MAG: hypothetical protein L6R38_002354 [Xanthoria sp. 2 TBL-2021]|nr:MAG: hypothetical protein L6R38_002354 [Xanthoria sp. 2 TBL-2021]